MIAIEPMSAVPVTKPAEAIPFACGIATSAALPKWCDIDVSIVLITIEVPKPVINVAGRVRKTGGERTNIVMPILKIERPIQLARVRPKRCAIWGLAYPAKIDAIPIAVPCRPATVSDVP